MLDIVRYCSVIANFDEVVQIYIDVNIIFNPVCILWNHAFHSVYVYVIMYYIYLRDIVLIYVYTYTHTYIFVFCYVYKKTFLFIINL